MPGFVLGVRLVLAAVFAVAGVAKLLDAAGSRAALEGFGVPRGAARPASRVLPVAELAIAAGLLVPASAWWSALAAAGLLAVFMVATGLSMARGAAPGCHCFGRLHSAPVSWRTQVRNGVLAAAAGVAVLAGRGASGLSPVRWACHLNAAELGLAAAVVALCRGGGGARLVPIRAFPAERPGPGPPGESGAAGRHRRPACDRGAGGCAACQRQGPRPGSCRRCAGPEFELPAADGRRVSLRALLARGLPVLLVFSDPGCGHCTALLPQVADWQHQHRDRLTVALASRRSAGQNAATPETHGLRDVLVQANREIAEAYQVNGTPSAVLIAASGKIASPLASGAQAITQLIHRATSSAPGRPSGGTRRQRHVTKLTTQARTCRRRCGTRPCPDRSAGPCTARPAGPGSASADTAPRASKREVPLSKINPAAWRDFPARCYSRAATCSPDTSAAPTAATEHHPLLVKSARHPCGARAGRGGGPLTTSAVLMISLPSFHSDPLQHTVQAPREGP